MNRKAYLTDISDDECILVASSLTLITEEAPQRVHRLRKACKGLHWLVRARAIAHDGH
jgi:hypothetical protein